VTAPEIGAVHAPATENCAAVTVAQRPFDRTCATELEGLGNRDEAASLYEYLIKKYPDSEFGARATDA